MNLFDSAGKPIAIEKELFRGGEGTIHPVVGQSRLLAKMYHRSVDPAKQAKLTAMAATASDGLLRVAAWPEATLHAGAGGRMVGFLMPRFDGNRSELHHLYRPGSRKQTFRRADWAFLVHAARNVAAAVDTVHTAGHVVGDVNQRNFIVGGDATVKVLDCDSFQIRQGGRVFRCPVGVPEFTPPELQNRPLDGIERTPNHDAFGLAVLIFQLLFMGRHPFAGRYLGTGDMPIERAIAEGRFAFGRHNRSRLMEAPPNLIPFESLPPRLAALFEAAFGGAMRPHAKQWADGLEVAQTELRSCASEPMHKFYRALPDCPWCALERTGNVYYFIGVAAAQHAPFDLGALWAAIMASTNLPYVPPPRPTFHLTGTPVPAVLEVRRGLALGGKVVASLMLGGLAVQSPDWIVLAFLGIVLMAVLPLPGASERRARLKRLHEAESAWQMAYRAAEGALSVEPLQRKRLELQRVKATYESADAERAKDLAKLTQDARAIQLNHFLEQQLIRNHDIPDIGPKRKATLAAWGIDTAADITRQSVSAVQGFGPTLQSRLLAWRLWIESKFVFDAKRAVPQQDVDAIEYRWRRRKNDLEQQLRVGAEEARRMSEAIRQRRASVAAELEQPARDWAQSAADVEVITRALSFRGGRS